MRLAHNPIDGRIYFFSGDWSGLSSDYQSGRNEVYSYSIKDGDWRLEYPYCGFPGEPIASNADEVGWVFDQTRNLFWMMPGYMWGTVLPNSCPHSPTWVKGKTMTFNPVTKQWDVPNRKSLCATLNICGELTKFAVLDPVRDLIIHFVHRGRIAIYDIQADAWRTKDGLVGDPYLGMEQPAVDYRNRKIYIIDPGQAKLYRYDMDTEQFAFVTSVPAASTYDMTNPVWDSVDNVLLYPHYLNHGGLITKLYIYHPDTNVWETQDISQPVDENGNAISAVVRGNSAVYDPIQNVMLIMGAVFEAPSPYLFFYRYGNGSGGQDRTAPNPPANLRIL